MIYEGHREALKVDKMRNKQLSYEVSTIERVDDGEEMYTVCWNKGTCCGLAKKYGVIPEVGQTIEIYGSFDIEIQGICINGKTAFFRGEVELEYKRKEWLRKNHQEKEERFEASKAELDKDYESLPDVFKKRIDRFRKGNSKFRIDNEAYEMSCCKDAVKIAERLKTVEAIGKWVDKKWEDQIKEVPGLFKGHSGNSFGCAVGLAKLYIEKPEMVIKAHGALTPLVGCKEYGCTH